MSDLKNNLKVGYYAFWYVKGFPFIAGGKVQKIVDNFKTSGFYRIDFSNDLFNGEDAYKFNCPDIILNSTKGLILLNKLKDLMNQRTARINQIKIESNNQLLSDLDKILPNDTNRYIYHINNTIINQKEYQ